MKINLWPVGCQVNFQDSFLKEKNKIIFNTRKYGNSNNKNGKVLTHFIEVCLMEVNNPSKVRGRHLLEF